MQLGPKFRNVEGGGLTYWCQGCKHAHMIWVSGQAPEDGRPRWGWNGNITHPVFTPSVLVTGKDLTDKGWADYEAWYDAGCPKPAPGFEAHPSICHTFVGCNGAQPGEVIFLGDCTHALKGTVQPFPDLPEHMQGDRWSDGGTPTPPPVPFTWIKK